MDEDLKAAGDAIEAVRVDRGLTQHEAAAEAGVSVTTYNVAAKGRERLSPRMAARIMRWCGWTADSYKRLLAGEEPRQEVHGTASPNAIALTAHATGTVEPRSMMEQFEERLRRVEALVEQLVNDQQRAE